jgi:truncated hemoglobin YjbI
VVDYQLEFESSVSRVLAPDSSDAFFSRFYELFVGSDPRIAKMFEETDMTHQKNMLRDSLAELREFSTSLKSNNYIVTLARIHGVRGRKVSPESYDTWLNALVETVCEMDPECSVQTELSWRLVLAPGIAFMKFYYDR